MKRIRAVALAGLLVTSLVAGCSTPQESRINKNRAIYDTWPLNTREAVLAGKVERGMTADMVRMSWGEPKKIVDSNANEQVWTYEIAGEPGRLIDPATGMPPNPATIGVSSRRVDLLTANGSTTGPGGSSVQTGLNSAPVYSEPTPPEVHEVVFREGIVYRADLPLLAK